MKQITCSNFHNVYMLSVGFSWFWKHVTLNDCKTMWIPLQCIHYKVIVMANIVIMLALFYSITTYLHRSVRQEHTHLFILCCCQQTCGSEVKTDHKMVSSMAGSQFLQRTTESFMAV